jgi:hypothetical protein
MWGFVERRRRRARAEEVFSVARAYAAVYGLPFHIVDPIVANAIRGRYGPSITNEQVHEAIAQVWRSLIASDWSHHAG